MQIAALNLKNFKKFDNRDFQFFPGINVVIGENEAGKTTLLNSIITSLYLDPTTKSRKLLEKITPWRKDTQAILTMKLVEEEKSYEIVKDFAKQEARFRNLSSNQELNEMELINRAIVKLIGIPTVEIYQNTAFVKQAELASLESSKDMVNAIQKSISSGNDARPINEVIKNLDKKINELSVGLNRPAKNPGKIKVLEDTLAQLNLEFNQKKGQWDKFLKAKMQGKESSQDLGEVDKNIKLLEQLIENHKVLDEAQKELEKIEKSIEEQEKILQRINKTKSRIKEQEEKKGEITFVQTEEFMKDSDLISDLNNQIKAKSEMLKKFESKPQKKIIPKKQTNKSLILSGLSFILLGAILGLLLNSYLFGLILIGLVLIFLDYLAKPKDDMIENNQFDRQIQDLEGSIEQDKVKLGKILFKYKAKSFDEFFKKKMKFITLREGISQLKSELEGVLGGRSEQILHEEQAKLFVKKKEIEQNQLTDEVKASKLSAQDYLAKRRELDSLKIKKRTLERQNIQADVRQEDGDISEEELSILEEQIEFNRKKLELAQKDLRVLELIKEGIEYAKGTMSSTLQKSVLEKIEGDINQITEGKYKEIKIDENFNILVFSKEKEDWIDPLDNLSTGTIDQIFFVYRLALLKMIEGEKQAPLLLDDPFVTFDKKRLEQTKEILKREAEKRQVILFTHNNDFESWGHLVRV